MAKLGIQIGEQTYAWLEALDEASLSHHAAQEQADKVIGGVVFLSAVVFLLLSGFFFYLDGIEKMLNANAIFSSSWGALFFWFAILDFCFLFSHQRRITRKVSKMPKVQKGESSEIVNLNGEALNIADVFSIDAKTAIETGYKLASDFGHGEVEPLHIFVGTLETNHASVIFGRLGLTFDQIKQSLGNRLNGRQRAATTELSKSTERLLLLAFDRALKEGDQEVSASEIFLQAFEADEFLQELALEHGVSTEQMRNMVAWIRIHEQMRSRYERFRKAAAYKPTGPMNRAMTSVATPILDAFSEDLTTAAVSGRLPMMVARDKEVEEIFRVIEGGRQSALLVGPEGVGKTVVLAGIAQLMVEERVPKILQDKRLVRLSLPHLVSGVDTSMAQERLLQLFLEVNKSRNIILAVTDIDQLGGELAASFVDFLSRAGTFTIATTTPRAYVAQVERSILSRIFQKVDVREPNESQAIHMLESKIGGIEHEHKVVFSYDAVEKAVQLSDRYMHESYLPKKAINIAREAALMVGKSRGADALVTGEDIAQIVTEKTGVKATSVGSEEKETLLNLEERMHGRVIGQNEAVKAVASALRRARAELRSQDRPIATFLFLGPTGVGKTELAKTVAEVYFGNQDAMIRMDMSEYQDQSSIHRLIGAPGSNQGGLLTEAVRKNPFSIVLLDELEKAHPEILHVFLQVFDDGRLTDAAGRTIDFTNTILVATSNAGSAYIQDAVGREETVESMKTHLIEEELKGVYRPEFLNRFDGIIVFKPLTQDEIVQIASLMAEKVSKRLEPKGIFFRAEPEALQMLAEKGYDPKFGARPLRRVVQEEVDNAIATALLEGKVKRRDTIILKSDGTISIEKGAKL